MANTVVQAALAEIISQRCAHISCPQILSYSAPTGLRNTASRENQGWLRICGCGIRHSHFIPVLLI